MDKKKENRAFSSFCSVLWTGQMETMWELMRLHGHIS